MSTVTFEAGVQRASPTLLQRLPLRAISVAGIAALAMVAGAAWIAMPGTSVSTDDAYVKADSTIIAPKVQGLIAEILVRDNEPVTAGQPLVRIDAEDYQQAVSAAEADVQFADAALAQQAAQEQLAAANVRAADASIRAADAESARADSDWKRFDALVTNGSVARREAEQKRAAALTAAADVDKSRAALAASEQQVSAIARSRGQLFAARKGKSGAVAGAAKSGAQHYHRAGVRRYR